MCNIWILTQNLATEGTQEILKYYLVFRSVWINFSRSRMQIYLFSLRLIEILH